MTSTPAAALWKHRADETLPDWDADVCFALFMRAIDTERPPTETERDDFARQVMQLVAMYFGRLKTIDGLRQVGIDPRHAAQDIAAFICDRVGRFKLETPCPKVMIKAFNRAIHNRLADAFAAARPSLSLTSTGDVFSARPVMPDIEGLGHQLRRKQTVLELIAGIPGDLAIVVRLARHQRDRILHGASPATRSQLPDRMRSCSHEQHALITARVLDFVRRWIESRGALQH
jgi:hypothetical protein